MEGSLPSERLHVSVVDDDESVRESLPDLLSSFGFDVRAFPSAESFLASDAVDATHCLVADIAMPGMTGPELQAQLKERRPALPIIFITGHGDETVRPRMLASGAVDCLLKPFSESALLDALYRAVGTPSNGGVTRGNASLGDRTARSHRSRRPPVGAIVFVVDDDVSVREAVEMLITSEGLRAETFTSAQQFLERPRVSVPSCLVLDVSLPDFDGLDLQTRIADRTDMPIIFITGYGDIPTSVRAMKAGAVDFLTKPFSDEVLLEAIHNALDRSQAALSHEGVLRKYRRAFESLSPREREVMRLVVAGKLNKQIGGELGISEITVKAHRGKVMRKMNAESLPDLVKIATLLEPP
jgi:FixJ family two-component response regulator